MDDNEEIQAQYDLDDYNKDYFGLLGTKDPVLILNPCDMTQPNFFENFQNENPYQKDEIDEKHHLSLLRKLKVGFVDKTQQKRKHDM